MQATTINPTINDLQALIDKVPRYPLSVGQLLKLAVDKGAPASVKNFYRKFGKDHIFKNKDDLLARTELVEIMCRQEADMPAEEFRATED